MVQTIKPDLEIKITVKCYGKSQYFLTLDDYDGMKFGIIVQSDTIDDCLVEIGKKLNALEIYRKIKNA